MRVDLLQLLAVLLFGGSAALSPSDCKSNDKRPKSGTRSSASDGKMVCSNMELHQVLPADSFPNKTLTL